MAVANPEVVRAIADPSTKGGVFGACKFVLESLKSAGLAIDIQLSPSQLGMHPCNRGKYGANEEAVHELASDIFGMGWDWSKVRDAVCVEDGPDRYVEKYNVGICDPSPMLADVKVGSTIAGTLTNGHTVLMLRALAAGVPSTAEGLSVNGRMSLASVASLQPEMARAATEGWKWCMIKHQAKLLYGDQMLEMLSGTANITLARAQHELEVLLKLWRLASDAMNRKTNVEWKSLAAEILKSKPDCGEHLPSMIRFVQEFGGGPEATFVNDLVHFHKRHVSGQRVVGNLWEHVTALVFKEKGGEIVTHGVLLRYAILKAAYSAPNDKVSNKVSKFFSKADFDNLAKKYRKESAEAEEILSRCRSIGQQLEVPGASYTKLLGALDVNVVRVLTKKQAGSAKQYKSMGEVASEYIKALSAEVGRSIDNPWAADDSAKEEKLARSLPYVPVMRTISDSGVPSTPQVAPEPAATGEFVVGATVAEKRAKCDKFTIVKVSDDVVAVKGFDGNIQEIPSKRFFAGWQLYEETIVGLDLRRHAPANLQFEVCIKRAAIQNALGVLSTTLPKPAVEVMSKPAQKVIATENIKAGCLTLAPATMKVISLVPGSTPPVDSIEVSLGEFSGATFHLCPHVLSKDITENGDALVVPFWCVGKTSSAEDANVEWSFVTVESTAAIKKGQHSGKTTEHIKIRVLQNRKAIKKGCEILVLNNMPVEPSKKKAKVEA
jgi:hypothetical protein